MFSTMATDGGARLSYATIITSTQPCQTCVTTNHNNFNFNMTTTKMHAFVWTAGIQWLQPKRSKAKLFKSTICRDALRECSRSTLRSWSWPSLTKLCNLAAWTKNAPPNNCIPSLNSPLRLSWPWAVHPPWTITFSRIS